MGSSLSSLKLEPPKQCSKGKAGITGLSQLVAAAASLGQNTLFFLLQMLSVNKTLTTEIFSSLGICSIKQNQGQRDSPFFHLPC